MAKNKRSLRINGLSNIAALMTNVPVGVTVQAQREKPARVDLDFIVNRTIDSLRSVSGTYTLAQARAADEHNRTILKASVREGFNLGHAQAMDQSGMVEEMLEKQYEARTKLTLPTAVAAIMEQVGLQSLVLDMATLATVFQRYRLDFVAHAASDEPVRDWIEYKLVLLDDKQPQPTEGNEA